MNFDSEEFIVKFKITEQTAISQRRKASTAVKEALDIFVTSFFTMLKSMPSLNTFILTSNMNQAKAVIRSMNHLS